MGQIMSQGPVDYLQSFLIHNNRPRSQHRERPNTHGTLGRVLPINTTVMHTCKVRVLINPNRLRRAITNLSIGVLAGTSCPRAATHQKTNPIQPDPIIVRRSSYSNRYVFFRISGAVCGELNVKVSFFLCCAMVRTRKTAQDDDQHQGGSEQPPHDPAPQGQPPLIPPTPVVQTEPIIVEDQAGPSSQQPILQQPIRPDEWRRFFSLFEQQSRIMNELLEERRNRQQPPTQSHHNAPRTIAEGVHVQGEASAPVQNPPHVQPTPPPQNPFNYVPPPPSQGEQPTQRPQSHIGGLLFRGPRAMQPSIPAPVIQPHQHPGNEVVAENNPANTYAFCATPFTAQILAEDLPPVRWAKNLPEYDGTGDPSQHILSFERLATCQGVREFPACRAFSLTLAGAAGDWFNELPKNSIGNWATLREKFLSRFTSSKKQFKSEYHLKNCVQGPKESLRDYITRFNKEALEVRNVAPNLMIYFITEGLQDGLFKKEVTGYKPETMEELKNRADFYIRLEENTKAAAEAAIPKDDKGKAVQRSDRQGGNYPQKKRDERKKPLGQFTSYTPLSTSVAQVYKQAMNSEITTRPPPMRAKFRDLKRWCDYHRDHGHSTNECVMLKDTIEQLIQQGRLQEFVKYDRNQRRYRRSRSPRRNQAQPRERETRRSRSPPRQNNDTPRGEIHVIAGGFIPSGGKRARDAADTCAQVRGKTSPALTFSEQDYPSSYPRDDEPVVITSLVHGYKVHRLFVDQGSSADIMFWNLFEKLGLGSKNLTPHSRGLVGFTGDSITPKGYVELQCVFGEAPTSKTVTVKFLVVECPSAYNAIIGRPTLNALGAVVSTPHLAMKFPGDNGTVVTIRGNQSEARSCYRESLKIGSSQLPEKISPRRNFARRNPGSSSVMMTSLDPRLDFEYQRPQPEGDLIEVQVGQKPHQVVKLGASLSSELRDRFVQTLLKNSDLFAWTPADMPGIDPKICCHKLSLKPGFKPVAQKKRRMGPERNNAIEKHVKDLLDAGFIREIRYADWISNVVMVKKTNGKWRMCTDYTDLNKACPKDPFPLPCIDTLVDNSAGYRYLSFMDAYSGYNQIPMALEDQDKTAFVTDYGVYCYTMMPFGLKNAGATYQRLMNTVFEKQIGRNLEVYIDDMIVKTGDQEDPVQDLEEALHQLRKFNMRLNPEKCTFGVEAGKFLGFMLTNRGIEANPDKCRAILEMKSPQNVKEVQRLTGRIAALARFLPSSAKKCLPLFKTLKCKTEFVWDSACEEAFQEIKIVLSSPPVLAKPDSGQPLILYLSVTEESLSAALVKENGSQQTPIYFVSKALQGSELNYQRLEKLAYALLVSSRRLRPYFQCHPIIVRTGHPLRQVLHRPDLAGRMMNWAIELSQYEINFEPRQAIKAQALADFLAEMTHPEPLPSSWTIYVDGSSNGSGSGAGIIIENGLGTVIEYSLKFGFKASNNQAEYEACLAGIRTAKELGASTLKICSDSQLVVSQIKGEYQAKEPILQKYLQKVREMLTGLDGYEIRHVPRGENSRADLLSKLASTKPAGNSRSVIEETIPEPGVNIQQETLHVSLVGPSVIMEIDQNDWRTSLKEYICKGTLPPDPTESKILMRKSARFCVIEDQLFRRGISVPLLKCIPQSDTWYILAEIHEGSCGQHPGGKTLARKALRAGYYWPTMGKDAEVFVKKCKQCQLHSPMIHLPSDELHSMSAPWPFHTWGLDLLGPFHIAPGQFKYLIVAVDYFTKWIEAEPLSTITSLRAQNFVFRQIICRFGIPAELITDNGTQFMDKGFRAMLEGLHIKHHFASVEHPQSNGQAESANKVILNGLKKRCENAKSEWVENLFQVLWGYRTTIHSSTGETPYRLVYGQDAVIPVEIGNPSWRVLHPHPDNNQPLREESEFVDEIRELARIKELSRKQQVAQRYNRQVQKRRFEPGSLVLRRANIGQKNAGEGKLAANWEGPYRVVKVTSKGAYYLESLLGKAIPRTFNVQDLKVYYS